MMKTRIGKIARLPQAVREELNRRLHEGERHDRLVEWLNGLREVQAVVGAEFAGRAISAQNLSDWKRGGYADWVAHQEALELAERLGEDTAEWAVEGKVRLSETLALWLAARYAVALRRVAKGSGEKGWRRLEEVGRAIVALRRGDHSAERLRLEGKRLDLEQERERVKTEAEFEAWAERNRERLCAGFRTQAEKLALVSKAMWGERPAHMAAMAGQSRDETRSSSGVAEGVGREAVGTGCGEMGGEAVEIGGEGEGSAGRRTRRAGRPCSGAEDGEQRESGPIKANQGASEGWCGPTTVDGRFP